MTTTKTEGYPLGEVDWAVPPGHLISESAEQLGMNPSAMISALGLSQSDYGRLLGGELILDEGLANRLQELLGVPSGLLLRLEAAYRRDLQRLASQETRRKVG